jgi:SEC-C motif
MPPIPQSANDPCRCGSGKKYKRCCRARERAWDTFQSRLHEGSIPFVAQVRTNGGASNSFTLQEASVTRGNFKKDLLTAPITLSVNQTNGSQTQEAHAQLVIPAMGSSTGTATTAGNAAVTMVLPSLQLVLSGGEKRLKISSPSGMFAILRVALQRNDGTQYFDVLFGQTGQSEEIGESGKKNRPHIAISPDGNGKFMRLDGHKCEVESAMTLDSSSGPIYPDTYRIRSLELNACIELRFSRSGPTEIELQSARFVQ